MAEFQEVMRQFTRMHKAHEYIPSESAFASAVRRPDLFEKSVMDWAAEHPEPEYPTWAEYLKTFGFPGGIAVPRDCDLRGCQPIERFVWLAENHVPAEIAQKLGLEPKEG